MSAQNELFEMQDTGYDAGAMIVQKQKPEWVMLHDSQPTLYSGDTRIVALYITANGTRLPYTLTALQRRSLWRLDVPARVLAHAQRCTAENANESDCEDAA